MSAWPEQLGEAALRGPAGEFVQLVEPHTEADRAALLAQLLVAFGAAAGRHSYVSVEASRHYPNEFCVLVGASGKGRKGSSWDHVESLLNQTDPDLTERRVVSGLSSGEGLIAEVRDKLDDQDTSAPEDKRLLVLEPEFAQVMKVLAREGNTLSPVVRNGWDGKRLQTLVRNAPLRASAAHVAIVGHITKDELLRYLNATELANGFFNRFLLIAVRRSKLLPFGGSLADSELDHLRCRLGLALAAAREDRELTFTADARERYATITSSCLTRSLGYSEPPPAARKRTQSASRSTTRCSTAQTRSISRTSKPPSRSGATPATAAAGCSATPLVTRPPTTSWALAKDRGDGISRTDVRDLFSRNKKAREIDRALTALVDAGRLQRKEHQDGRGRPAEIWVPLPRAA